MLKKLILTLSVCLFASPIQAGVYYSGDSRNELPAEWAGFLRDQRALRLAADPKNAGFNTFVPLRDTAVDAVVKLEQLRKTRLLTADELADLGALYLRLGQPEKAVGVLRPANRTFPEQFRIAANLGSAWQQSGDSAQAVAALEEAVRLAPKEFLAVESLHLKLVRNRAKEKKNTNTLDDLFGVVYSGDPGTVDAKEKAKLPANALALVQELALVLPFDPRLLWQLAELANAHGDVRTAANLLDGVIIELGFQAVVARTRRTRYRSAADELAKTEEHAVHRGTLKFASAKVFKTLIDETKLPKVDPEGTNPLPWGALSETTLTKKFQPKFLKYIEDCDGRTVRFTGFLRPTRNGDGLTEFLITESPIGCWFCESPGATQVIWVELADGKTVDFSRAPVQVTGRFELNRTDAESHLYRVIQAGVKKVD